VITVRRAVPADIGAMSDVLVASITALCVPDHGNRPDAVAQWLSNKTPEGVGKWFANPETSLFVADVEEVVAAVGAVSNRREILLNYVSPDHRFAGVSKALLAAMEAALGAGEARLTSTTTAHRFYQRTGWTDDGPAERYAGMTAYPMRKLL
jgi:GNAT superfamily N-acetyltransferase